MKLYLLKDIDGTYAFRDSEMKEFACLYPIGQEQPKKRNKFINFNCAKYEVIWID